MPHIFFSSCRNLIEPADFAALFFRHPPAGFCPKEDPAAFPFFETGYDLLTTLDSAVRKRVTSLPLYAAWKNLLSLSACFGGTTVTEYLPLHKGPTPQELVKALRERHTQRNALTIFKDLPQASPLLLGEDNAFADALVAEAVAQGFLCLEGQALAYVPIDFPDTAAYLSRLSPGRRKDLKRKLRKRAALDVEIVPLGDARFSQPEFLDELYSMYMEVYEQSDIHFDLLTKDFFTALLTGNADAGRPGPANTDGPGPANPETNARRNPADAPGTGFRGVVPLYWHEGKLAGYNICLIHENRFIDKYIGFRYPLARELNLYFISWMVNLDLARENGCTVYVAGWTDPEVKAGLGAKFTFTRHLVWIKNPLLRAAIRPFRHLFEADSRALNA